jgi:CheY-like chemotaxis protein
MKTILILEDEPLVMSMLRHMLKPYDVLGAATAAEALHCFHHKKQNVAILIADLSLPTSSGVEVALAIRLGTPDLPVILTSGLPLSDWSARDAAVLKRLGPDSVTVLQKPFLSKDLLEHVQGWIGAPSLEAAGTA